MNDDTTHRQVTGERDLIRRIVAEDPEDAFKSSGMVMAVAFRDVAFLKAGEQASNGSLPDEFGGPCDVDEVIRLTAVAVDTGALPGFLGRRLGTRHLDAVHWTFLHTARKVIEDDAPLSDPLEVVTSLEPIRRPAPDESDALEDLRQVRSAASSAWERGRRDYAVVGLLICCTFMLACRGDRSAAMEMTCFVRALEKVSPQGGDEAALSGDAEEWAALAESEHDPSTSRVLAGQSPRAFHATTDSHAIDPMDPVIWNHIVRKQIAGLKPRGNAAGTLSIAATTVPGSGDLLSIKLASSVAVTLFRGLAFGVPTGRWRLFGIGESDFIRA